ncbi:hypothetical protein QF010_006721 [Pseudomonas silensiensis]
MEISMNILWITAPLLAALFAAGCTSVPKEKTEYEKQIDAVPMPTTEADRLVQCKNLSNMYLFEVLGASGTTGVPSLFPSRDRLRPMAIYQRMVAMSCTRAERQQWQAF